VRGPGGLYIGPDLSGPIAAPSTIRYPIPHLIDSGPICCQFSRKPFAARRRAAI